MSTTKTFTANAFAFLDYDNQNANVHTGTQIAMQSLDWILFQFPAVPEAMRFKLVTSATFRVCCLGTASTGAGSVHYAELRCGDDTEKADLSSVTFALYQPLGKGTTMSGGYVHATDNMPAWIEPTLAYPDTLAMRLSQAISSGLRMTFSFNGLQSVTVGTSGTYAPYMSITYDDNTEVKALDLNNLSPGSGAIDKTKANIFAWHAWKDAASIPLVVQSSAVFQWRAGTSGAIRSINISGNAQSVTVPANTFTGASIQWRVVVTANSGVATTSDWITLSTADAASTAAPISPKGEVRDSGSPIEFSWKHIISTGTAQTKADLQISTDAATWTDLATITGVSTTYTAPASTLGSGTKYWRVRTYNADGVAGEWSDAAAFICIGAPAVPPISILSLSPRPQIGWQSDEQLAYQIKIDDVWSSGTYYGTDKQWTAPLYLEDGNYIVRVRVLNEYALWSGWGSAPLQVTNASSAQIVLQATSDSNGMVSLSWTSTAAFDAYLIYRDGDLVAKTQEKTYFDLVAIGAVSYRVRGIYKDSGNYALSAMAYATVAVQHVTVCNLDTNDIIILPYTDSAHRTTTRSLSRDVRSVQMSGRKYPTPEIGDHYAHSITVSCAFATPAQCATVEALCGHQVAVKTPEGAIVRGYMSALTARTDGGFYTSYQFTVDQADVQEVVDIDA